MDRYTIDYAAVCLNISRRKALSLCRELRITIRERGEFASISQRDADRLTDKVEEIGQLRRQTAYAQMQIRRNRHASR